MTTAPQPIQEEIGLRGRIPNAALIAGIILIIVGIFGFIDSYLILASTILLGWLVVGFIGFASLLSGIGVLLGSDSAYAVAIIMSALNLFVGLTEFLGAFNHVFAIMGWVGLGQAVGAGTLVLAALSLYLLSREDSKIFFNY